MAWIGNPSAKHLPLTKSGNHHAFVFQDFLTKFPLMFPVPDQKATHLAQLLAEKVVSLFGVPDCLLSDQVLTITFDD